MQVFLLALVLVTVGTVGCSKILGYDDFGFGVSNGGSGGDSTGGSAGSVDASDDLGTVTGGTAGASGAEAGPGGEGNSGGAAGQGEAGSAGTGNEVIPCSGQGPAYIHGDLWAFWHNPRVACDAQHRWLWICQQRLGQGQCSIEAQRFQDCWNAKGEFPPTSWGADSTPTPHSRAPSVCQPHQSPEKNSSITRPGNDTPCDTNSFDYDKLRKQDPFYGADWVADHVAVRHLTLKVFLEGQDPFDNEGQTDALIVLSSHPSKEEAFTRNIANHSHPNHVKAGGCLPPFTGDTEEPYPNQNVGAFFWLEVPTDQKVNILASWIGPTNQGLDPACQDNTIYGFPSSFATHSKDGNPWFITSPCHDLLRGVKLEPGRHYIWDINGLRLLDNCNGPPASLLDLVPTQVRASFKDGSCSSM